MQETETDVPPDVINSDTNNATNIQPEDAPPHKQAKFRKFRAYNTGLWNGPRRENTEVYRRQDDLQRYDSIASTLELTQSQKSRGRRVLDSIDLGKFNNASESVDDVVFAICILVANSDVHNGTRYWPHPDSSGGELFERFAEHLGLDKNEQMSILQRVRSRTEL